jgi:hypothetical protein
MYCFYVLHISLDSIAVWTIPLNDCKHLSHSKPVERKLNVIGEHNSCLSDDSAVFYLMLLDLLSTGRREGSSLLPSRREGRRRVTGDREALLAREGGPSLLGGRGVLKRGRWSLERCSGPLRWVSTITEGTLPPLVLHQLVQGHVALPALKVTRERLVHCSVTKTTLYMLVWQT